MALHACRLRARLMSSDTVVSILHILQSSDHFLQRLLTVLPQLYVALSNLSSLYMLSHCYMLSPMQNVYMLSLVKMHHQAEPSLYILVYVPTLHHRTLHRPMSFDTGITVHKASREKNPQPGGLGFPEVCIGHTNFELGYYSVHSIHNIVPAPV